MNGAVAGIGPITPNGPKYHLYSLLGLPYSPTTKFYAIYGQIYIMSPSVNILRVSLRSFFYTISAVNIGTIILPLSVDTLISLFSTE